MPMSKIIRSFRIPPGARIGNYKVLHCLGRGFECEVYAAGEVPTGVKRALKIFPDGDVEHTRLIVHRARIYERLSTTGSVVGYHHLGRTFLATSGESIIFLVFDLLAGVGVNQYMKQLRGIASNREREAIRLTSEIAEKISRVHALGYAVGDFEAGSNIIIRMADRQPIFCDLEAGSPNNPNKDFQNDLEEFCVLSRLIFRGLRRRKTYRNLHSLLENFGQKRVSKNTFQRLSGKLSDLLEEIESNSASAK